MSLYLVFPTEKHQPSYEKLRKEWVEGESPSALFRGKNFEDFLRLTREYTLRPNGRVPSHLFFLMYDEEIVGGIDIRHSIDHPNLIEKGGHIGYGIAPKWRRKGYATEMLKWGLIEAKNLCIDKILITCAIDNIGSNKVIQKNGGIFERLTHDGTMNRYWIDIV